MTEENKKERKIKNKLMQSERKRTKKIKKKRLKIDKIK